MFNNIGNKIKIIAKVNFWLMVLVSVICACYFGISESYYFYSRHTELTAVFWIFIIIGPIVAYLSTVLVYGFGELIVQTSETKEYVKTISESMTKY